MNILVTGGLGFIGSHTVVELLNAGHTPIILDNLSNSSPKVLSRIAEISGSTPIFYQGDILDRALLRQIFATYKIDSVIHFAALKAVGESVAQPLRYYENNVSGSIVLLQQLCMVTLNKFPLRNNHPQAQPLIHTAHLNILWNA